MKNPTFFADSVEGTIFLLQINEMHQFGKL
jgi:hypothetical protein